MGTDRLCFAASRRPDTAIHSLSAQPRAPRRRRRSDLFAAQSVSRVPSVDIRVAHQDDWARIWPFFSDIVAAGETYAYPDGLTPETARSLWMQEPPGQTVVAVEAEVVLGSAVMGPNRPGRGSHVATASFMVDPASQGQGVGRSLGHYAVGWARAAGYRSMQFNAVVETNTAAVKLWQSLGFEILATVPDAFDHPGHGLVGLHVMFRRF
jgi:L-amino acid N-acyltransferase YncA